jgi:hypothetical protein
LLYDSHLVAEFPFGTQRRFQEINIAGTVHPVLTNPASPTGAIRFFPSHPHEGAVGASGNESARVIAAGTCKVTGRRFNPAVAFEPGAAAGPAVVQSTFHYFADYNWDVRHGCPSFVDEPPGDSLIRTPEAMADTRRYVENVARWLAGRPVSE